MRILELDEIRRTLSYSEIIGRMREALRANWRGECDTPMPMHLDIPAERAEIHMKSSYRRGGKYFALKIASTFPGNVARGLSTGNGVMLLSSAETGATVALLADYGHLTDVRTAAAARTRRSASSAQVSRHGCKRECMPKFWISVRFGFGAARRRVPKNAAAILKFCCRAPKSRSPGPPHRPRRSRASW
jgi:hypothetical protein